jgi:phosphoesterase RecJ-like protein
MNNEIKLKLSQVEIKQTLEQIGEADLIVITAHQNPDGDAVGSMLGLFHILKYANKNCVCVLPDRYPDFLKWMPGTEQIIFFDESTEKASELLNTANLIFCLDYNCTDRTGKEMGPVLKAAKGYKVMIDHHPLPEDFCNLTINSPEDCSTCQLIYRFVATLGYENHVNEQAATCLYVGLVTDTGSFRYPSTKAITHQIAGNLIQAGANNGQIHINLFDTNTESRLRLLGFALTQKLVVLRDHATAYFVLTQDELADYNYAKGDTEGLVNYGLSMEGIKLAAIFMETDKLIKISFRSKGDVAVNEFMAQNFSGGGHKNAAGGRSNKSLDVTIQQFLSLIPAFMDQYK